MPKELIRIVLRVFTVSRFFDGLELASISVVFLQRTSGKEHSSLKGQVITVLLSSL